MRALIWFLILFFFFPSFFPLAGQELIKVKNLAFIRGEKIKFKAYYDSFVTGKVTAGIVTLEVKPEIKQIEGRSVYHIVGELHSKGAFNLFFKVDDRFETFLDEEYLVPWIFIRRTHEGSFKYNDDVRFNQFTGYALSTRANKKIPVGTQDLLSTVFFTRNFDLLDIQPGDCIPISFYLDDSLYVSQIQFVGKEDITIDLGQFKCLRFKPMVAIGNVFSQPYPMDVWVTDDKNHIPILAKSAVIVGSVKIELIKYQGLANPFSAIIEPVR